MTRSGCIFAPLEVLARSRDKGKANTDMGEREREKTVLTANDEAPIGKLAEEGDDLSKREISVEEATEFLRIIQQGEFKVIEQLNKTLARISLLGLLMNFKPHWVLLVKILNKAHVAQDISMKGFGGIVNNITANNYLTFADEEMLVEGRGHNNALHVFIKCMDHIVAKVLIDNGSSLNVMPKMKLDKLSFDALYMRPSSMVVRAFVGSRCDVRGEIDLPIQIGQHTCQMTFQVMDINPAYSCLLGRPWIHSVGVVPSTLHQKLKFVVKGQLVIVSGEEDILVSCLASTPYVEAMEESLETSFQALEIVNSAYVESPLVQPRLFGASLMVAQVMLRDGYKHEMGLGRNSDGTTSLVKFSENRGRFGLGYEPTNADKRKISLERKERSLARLQGQGPQVGRIPICHINESFVSVGWMHEDQVAMLDEETIQDQPNWVQSCSSGFELKNWQIK
ncbi:uncharacterized protein [Glycine max]|uniref:uncharacterized protein n=1 Tax=Glycine max TaxID=3847 RepID=UPI0003DE905A|nr:uncharacterized protein LOC100787060 [Glycine max]|eukprot:XP_006606748.1 uncharacterized protein LOC100787060 [Glycine max]